MGNSHQMAETEGMEGMEETEIWCYQPLNLAIWCGNELYQTNPETTKLTNRQKSSCLLTCKHTIY